MPGDALEDQKQGSGPGTLREDMTQNLHLGHCRGPEFRGSLEHQAGAPQHMVL